MSGAFPPLQALVIGGGLGGLCLAQGLKRSGIDVTVFERDASARFRGQGYRISIKSEGADALRACLPERLFELCVATSIRSALRMVFMDSQLNVGFSRELPHPDAAPDPAFFGVNRLTLREILLAGLEDCVRFGKTFTRFEETGDGRVRALFADGSSAEGDLLIGADGTNSAVRPFLAPDAQIDELRYIMYGLTPIGADTLAWAPDALVDTFNNLRAPDGVTFSVATCRTWEPVALAAARLAPEVHLTDIPGYFSWTLEISADYRDADAATLRSLALTLVKDWRPAVRRLIAEAEVSATFPITVTSAQPVAPWDSPNVTLLGDAIHTMSPGRGEGANTALRDAALLRARLEDVVTRGKPLRQAKAEYEAEMLRYGFEAVTASRSAPFSPSAFKS
jgi:2-polyprenyl-6-methoxyphenol hydroxylase-like FAD-dependent oxidoreductase